MGRVHQDSNTVVKNQNLKQTQRNAALKNKTKQTKKEKGVFIRLILVYYSPWLRKLRKGAQDRNLEAGLAEAME